MTSSDEEILPARKHKKVKNHHVDDRATSKFYTKDESQEDLPYVADNVFNTKKQKKTKLKKKSLHSNNQLSYKVCIHLVIIIIKIINNYIDLYILFLFITER